MSSITQGTSLRHKATLKVKMETVASMNPQLRVDLNIILRTEAITTKVQSNLTLTVKLVHHKREETLITMG